MQNNIVYHCSLLKTAKRQTKLCLASVLLCVRVDRRKFNLKKINRHLNAELIHQLDARTNWQLLEGSIHHVSNLEVCIYSANCPGGTFSSASFNGKLFHSGTVNWTVATLTSASANERGDDDGLIHPQQAPFKRAIKCDKDL